MSILRRSRPFILPLSCLSVYTLHKQHDQREISKEEVLRSRDQLSRLSTTADTSSRRKRINSTSTSGTTTNPDATSLQHQRRHHLKNIIHNGGVTVLPNLLQAEDLKTWNHHLYAACSMHQDDSDNHKSKFKPNRIVSNRGRLHSHQESTKSHYNSHFLKLIASMPQVQSIVRSYFKHYSIEQGRYHLTQVEFILAKPGSEHQIWHQDNVNPGLTLLIALKDVGGNGPTELLRDATLNGDNCNGVIDNVNDATLEGDDEEGVILACLTAGDAILCDARVLHRGRGFGEVGDEDKKDHTTANAPANTTSATIDIHRDRPVLVLRWDALSTPPPGAASIVTNFNGWLGSYRIFVIEVKGLIRWILPS